MGERALLGGISGIMASMVCALYEVIVEHLGVTDRGFLDFNTVLIAHKVYAGALGFTISLLAQAAVGVIFGTIFSYTLIFVSSKYYLLKGLGYGFILWLLLSGFGTIFKLPLFEDMPPMVSLVNLGDSLLYGSMNAYFFITLGRHNTKKSGY